MSATAINYATPLHYEISTQATSAAEPHWGTDIANVKPLVEGQNFPTRPQRYYPIVVIAATQTARVVGPVLAGTLLAGSAATAFALGMSTGIKQIIRSTGNLDALGKEREALMQAAEALSATPLSVTSQCAVAQDTAALSDLLRDSEVAEQITRAVAGAGITTATGVLGIGLLLSPPLIGSVSASATAASVVLVSFVAAPLVSALGVVMTGYRASQVVRANADASLVDVVLDESVTGYEQHVAALLAQRLHDERLYDSLSGAAYLGVAVGVPLTFFGGPYGLTVLMPSLLMVGVTGSLRRRRLEYVTQLSASDKLAIDSQALIVNEVARADASYCLLKGLKQSKRPRYPYGGDSSLGPVVRSINRLRNALDPDRLDAMPSAAQIIATYAQLHHAQELMFLADKRVALLHDQTTAAADPARVIEMATRIAACEKEMLLLQTSGNELPDGTGTPTEALQHLGAWMQRQGLGTEFSARLGADPSWGTAWETWFSEPGACPLGSFVELLGHEPQANQALLLGRAQEVAEALLLSAAKTRAQFRERELLDYLRARLRA